MSSRQEEKERRRLERVAAEEATARSEARKRRLRLLVGAGLALAAVAAVVIAIVASGSNDKGPKTDTTANGKTVLPPRQVTDLPTAAKAAGCRTQDTTAGKGSVGVHVTTDKVKYATNPPSYGPHNPTAASDGNYVDQGTPKAVNYVHSLEHGRIEIEYKPGTPRAQVDQLQALFNEPLAPYGPTQYLLLFENNTKMPSAVAAAAWDHLLTCPTFNPKIFDAIRAFRVAYTLKAPEFVNQPE